MHLQGLSYSGKYRTMILLKVFFKQVEYVPLSLIRQNKTIKPINRPQTLKRLIITLKKLVFINPIDKNTLAGHFQYLKILLKNLLLVMITGSGDKIVMKNF
jgi:hypothetical protein